MQVISEWFTYVQDERIVTNLPSVVTSNYNEFIENRHDQSIFSLLSYNEGIKFIPQIDQYCVEHGYDLSRKIVERHGIRN